MASRVQVRKLTHALRRYETWCSLKAFDGGARGIHILRWTGCRFRMEACLNSYILGIAMQQILQQNRSQQQVSAVVFLKDMVQHKIWRRDRCRHGHDADQAVARSGCLKERTDRHSDQYSPVESYINPGPDNIP